VQVNLLDELKDMVIVDSGCSGHMTGDESQLEDFEAFGGGYVAFGNVPKGGKIVGRGTLKTGNLDFKKVFLVRGLKLTFLAFHKCVTKRTLFFLQTLSV
jgi:hypothetical protein